VEEFVLCVCAILMRLVVYFSLLLSALKVDAKGTFTYWLNKLQGQPPSLDMFETLNPLPGTIDESCVLHRCQMVSLCEREAENRLTFLVGRNWSLMMI